MRLSYHAEQLVLYPVAHVFAFLADPGNLPPLMPPWQRPRIVRASIVPPPPSAVHPGLSPTAAGAGTQLTLSFRPIPHIPVRLSWQAEIDEFIWNDRFCDRQVRGPFADWYHCHRVHPVAMGGVKGTLIVDHVDYRLPFGAAGSLAHRLVLGNHIERAFAYRRTQIAKLLAHTASQPATAA